MSTTEATVPTGDAAFDAARASLEQSSDQASEAETPEETTPSEEQPSEQPAEVADQAPETTDTEDAILTQEQLEALTPKERQQAEKWQAKLTQKAQALSAREKELERRLQEAEAAAKAPPAEAKAQDTAAPDDLPPELAFLKPYFDRVEAKIRAEYEPVKQATEKILTETAAAETEATEKAFEAKHADYRQLEPQMLELGKKFVPIAGSMTDEEYLETLYTLAKAKQTKVQQIKETVQRINKSAASVEPKTTGVSESRVETTRPANWHEMTDQEQMMAAYEAAGRGERWK